MKRRAALLPRVQSFAETNNIPLPPWALPGMGGTSPSHHHSFLRGSSSAFHGRSQDTCVPWRDQDLSQHTVINKQVFFPFPDLFLVPVPWGRHRPGSCCFTPRAGQPVGVTAAQTAGRSCRTTALWLAEIGEHPVDFTPHCNPKSTPQFTLT